MVSDGKRVWQQRSRTTPYMNRDYVCGESFDEISKTWFPVDWHMYSVCESSERSDRADSDGAAEAFAHRVIF